MGSESEEEGSYADQLTILVSKRKTIRGQITRNHRKVDNLGDIDATNERSAKILLERLKKDKKEVEKLDSEIASLTDPEKIDTEAEKAAEYRDTLLDDICGLEVSLTTFDKETQRAAAPAATQAAPTAASDASSSGGFRYQKLPDLELTTFDGDPIHWDEFWDDFTTTVDSREDVPVITKFKLLKGALKGEALRAIDGYLLTKPNYRQVKETLKERYGDEDVAVFAHFQALLAIEPANYDMKQLQAVRDRCEMHIRSLVALGLKEDDYGRVFVPIILSKLPRFVQTELHRKNGSNKWTLSGLRILLKEELTARERTERYGTPDNSKVGGERKRQKGKSSEKGQNSSQGSSASTLFTQGKKTEQSGKPQSQPVGQPRGDQGGKPILPCIFCSESHSNWQCTKFPDVESRMAKIRGKCFKCLKHGHMKEDCPSKAKTCFYCGKTDHNSSLCFQEFPKTSSKGSSGKRSQVTLVQGTKPDASVPKTAHVAAVNGGGTATKQKVCVLKTALTTAIGERGQRKARIIFDDGSTLSFVRIGIATEIGAKCVGVDTTCLGKFGDKKRTASRFQIFEVDVVLKNGEKKRLQLNGVDQISTPIELTPLDDAKYPFLKSLELAQPRIEAPVEVEIDILLGLDYYYEFLMGNELRSGSGLVFVPSSLGYLVTGYLEQDEEHPPGRKDNQMLCLNQKAPEYDLERFWRLEDVGIVDKPGQSGDEIAMDFFNRTVKKEDDGRYSVKWPYKEEKPELPDNYDLARKRLVNLMKKIQPDEKVLEVYNQTIADQKKKGIIEEAPEESQGLVTYLPHHCVIKPGKTTKLRVVFDASAKMNKMSLSLNECLYRGPVLLVDLCGLVLRFRMKAIGIVSDVEKAFLQVGLQVEDRDVTRFLWLKDPTKPVTDDNLVIYRFGRVMFGTNASPFLLAATIIHHMKLAGTPTADEIIGNMYVDNVISARDTAADAVKYYQEAKGLFQSASMNLREWYTNCQALEKALTESDRGKSSVTSVLGLKWNTVDDTLECSVGQVVKTEVYTKRHVLKSVASVYDPCGWMIPVTIRGRIAMQQLWTLKVGWDDPLPNEIRERCSSVREDLTRLASIKLGSTEP